MKIIREFNFGYVSIDLFATRFPRFKSATIPGKGNTSQEASNIFGDIFNIVDSLQAYPYYKFNL